MALPFGSEPSENPIKGHANSAPAKPDIFKKVAAATGLLQTTHRGKPSSIHALLEQASIVTLLMLHDTVQAHLGANGNAWL